MDRDSKLEFPSLKDMNPMPRIDILLPSKERFGPKNAGAISGVVLDLIEQSQTSDCFRVIGTDVEPSFTGVAFKGMQPRNAWLHGRNIGLAAAYLHHLRTAEPPDLVEVHSRCHVAAYIKRKHPDLKVTLYLHNDPRDMKGSRSVTERLHLLQSMSAITCVSDYIRDCFLDGIDPATAPTEKVATARNGAQRPSGPSGSKKQMILLAGRMVPEKGILEFSQALAAVLGRYPEWEVVIAGARRFEASKPGSYEAQIADALAPIEGQTRMTGFLPKDQLLELQKQAAIIACPSIWDDPMPKAVLEALAVGSALLTTRRGGIPEVAEGRAHIVDNPDVSSFADAIDKLVSDQTYRERLQDLAWQDFPFTASQMADDADTIRATALGRPQTGW